jgi:predicted  nucleic acid-binding Zn-ribbon protein
MKKNTNVKKIYSKDEVAVILEDIRSQFGVFGEAHNLLVDKADNLASKVDSFENDVKNQFIAFGEGQDVLSRKADNLETKVDVMDERLKNVEVKVDVMDERLVRIEDNVVEIKQKLSEKVDLEDFQKREIRLVKLEKIVFERI